MATAEQSCTAVYVNRNKDKMQKQPVTTFLIPFLCQRKKTNSSQSANETTFEYQKFHPKALQTDLVDQIVLILFDKSGTGLQ